MRLRTLQVFALVTLSLVTTACARPGLPGRVIPPNCGDGVLDSDEECDRGPENSDSTPDACRLDCRSARCGDGVIDSGELCDPPGPQCSPMCLPIGNGNCGDGVIDPGEACDPPDGCNCSGDCQLMVPGICGNGVLDCFEACDDGALNSDFEPDACRTDCQLPYCGDGVTDSGEECDDPASPICDGLCQLTQGPVGSPCLSAADCLSGLCLDEPNNFWPGGLCVSLCGANDLCTDGGVCVQTGDGSNICIPSCQAEADCRQGYSCFDLPGIPQPICVGDCQDDADCPVTGQCNPYLGFCIFDQGLGRDGDACNFDDDCESGTCIDEAANGWPGGYCTSWCSTATQECPQNGFCLDTGQQLWGLCLKGCSSQADCRVNEGYACFAGACQPTAP